MKLESKKRYRILDTHGKEIQVQSIKGNVHIPQVDKNQFPNLRIDGTFILLGIWNMVIICLQKCLILFTTFRREKLRII